MIEHDMSKLIERNRGRYLLVSSLARRVRALQSGAKPLIGRGTAGDLTQTALEEFRQRKVRVSTVSDFRLSPDEELPEQPQEPVADEEAADDEA